MFCLRLAGRSFTKRACNYYEPQRNYRQFKPFVMPKDDEIPTTNILDAKKESSLLIGIKETGYDPDDFRRIMKEREAYKNKMPTKQDAVPTRTMSDSFFVASIPVGTESDHYASVSNTIRHGRMLQDFDTFCCVAGYKHVFFPSDPGVQLTYGVVTAVIDSIIFTDFVPRAGLDMRIHGHVSWTGKSSLEIVARIDQKADSGNRWRLISQCICICMVHDMLNNRHGIVNRLVGTTEEEKAYIKAGDERNILRKKKRSEGILLSPPEQEERDYIRSKFYKSKDIFTLSTQGIKSFGTEPSIFMAHTCMSSVNVTQAQDRNPYHTVFGGYILRHSYELAMATAWNFSRQKAEPRLICGDDLIFKLPIKVGSMLKFTAAVGYVEGLLIHCFVTLMILNTESGEANTSNTFHYIFRASENKKLPIVIPISFEETLLYIDCRRHFKRLQQQGVIKDVT